MIFRHIQRYWCIFSHTHKRATRGRYGKPPLPCLKIKKVSWFLNDLFYLWVKYSIHNVVLRESYRSVPVWQTSPASLFWIFYGCTSAICTQALFFLKLSMFNNIHFYWGILTHIETLLKHTHVFLGIFSTLCNPYISTILSYFEPYHIYN